MVYLKKQFISLMVNTLDEAEKIENILIESKSTKLWHFFFWFYKRQTHTQTHTQSLFPWTISIHFPCEQKARSLPTDIFLQVELLFIWQKLNL